MGDGGWGDSGVSGNGVGVLILMNDSELCCIIASLPLLDELPLPLLQPGLCIFLRYDAINQLLAT